MDTTTATSPYSPCSLPDLLASFSQTFCNSTLCFEGTLRSLPPHLFVRTFLESARTFANNPLPPQTPPSPGLENSLLSLFPDFVTSLYDLPDDLFALYYLQAARIPLLLPADFSLHATLTAFLAQALPDLCYALDAISHQQRAAFLLQLHRIAHHKPKAPKGRPQKNTPPPSPPPPLLQTPLKTPLKTPLQTLLKTPLQTSFLRRQEPINHQRLPQLIIHPPLPLRAKKTPDWGQTLPSSSSPPSPTSGNTHPQNFPKTGSATSSSPLTPDNATSANTARTSTPSKSSPSTTPITTPSDDVHAHSAPTAHLSPHPPHPPHLHHTSPHSTPSSISSLHPLSTITH